LEQRAPIADRDHVIELRVVMNEPRPDGLSSAEEFETLVAVEKALTAEIERAGNTLYVGRVTHAGVRDFHYYTAAPEVAEAALRRAMAAFPAYEFELGAEPDPDWEVYRNYLLPSARDRQRMANRQVLAALKDNGDQLSAPREIDHWAYFASAEARDAFLKRTALLGYTAREALSPADIPGNEKFGARIFRIDAPDDDFDEVTLELFELAAELGGEYDGWESPVEKPPETRH
jgi:hypothetical protein